MAQEGPALTGSTEKEPGKRGEPVREGLMPSGQRAVQTRCRLCGRKNLG